MHVTFKKKSVLSFLLVSLLGMTVSISVLNAQMPDPEVVPQLPPLRKGVPARAQIDRDMGMRERAPRGMTRNNDDMAKVAPAKCKKPTGKFPWNFDKAKMSDIVDQVSRLTCENFIISAGVKPSQEMSIISRTPITVDQAWKAFLSMLEANELALVKVGEFQKIVKRNDSIRQPIPVLDKKNEIPNSEGMITYLHDLRHISKDVAQSLVKGLISRLGDVLVVGDTFLVITDGASNIRRVMQILNKVDVAGASNRIHVIDLVYADAQQIQQKLNEIFESRGGNDRNRPLSAAGRAARIRNGEDGGGEGFSVQKIIADERTNKLIAIASDKAYERIKEMVDMLDIPSSDASSQGQVNVYYLKNGDAKKIATTLSTLTQGLQNGNSRNSGGPRMGIGGGFRDGGELFEGEIKVTADEATNSLVIVASPRDFKSMAQVIAKLDKERTQVYVEAVIMDIGLIDKNDFGINAYGGIPGIFGGTGIIANPGGVGVAKGAIESFGGALLKGGTPSMAAAAGLAGFLNTVGYVGKPVDLELNGAKLSIPGIGVVLEALQKFSNVDVLSTPSLMMLDNEKGEMSVGEKVPTVSGVSATGSGALAGLGIPIQNITYQDVKLKFSITPHVNDDNKVRLEIDQDINELGQQVEVTPGNKQWHIRTKAAKTTISAKDQQTVVLGGLIDQRQTNVETKIPILGDIPIIGHLFKHTSKEVVRKNLLLVLTPYVIRSDDDLRKIHERKNREREEFGKLYFGDKITRYDPYVDYDKKSGPLSRMIREVGAEMQKTENGGPGLPGEIVIKPPEKVERKDKSLDISIPDAGGSATMSDPAPENIEPLPGDFRGEDPFDDVPSLQDQGDIPPPPPPPPPPPENIQ